MRVRVSFLAAMVCLLGISMPAFARTLSASLVVSQTTKIANVQLKPGQYRFVADSSTGQVKVERQYKVVAKVKGEVVKLNKKSNMNEVLTDNNNITEIHFAGTNEAIKF